MKVACHQTSPYYRDIEANLAEMSMLALSTSADLQIFPELALTGYLFVNKAEIEVLAETIDGPLAARIGLIAKQADSAIVTGFLERDGSAFYNSSLLFDRHGSLKGHYRKVHLFNKEKDLFQSGNFGFPISVIELASGEQVKIGMMICYDWRFPEAARSLALHGAELIAVPANIVTTTGMIIHTLQTRAFENKVIIAFADRVGEERSPLQSELELRFQGQSAIINYNGDLLSELSRNLPGSIIVEIEPKSTKSKSINQRNDIFGDRKPASYEREL